MPSNSKAIMNKLELIAALAEKQELSKAEAARIVNVFFDSMIWELCNEDKVEIRGFCSLKVKNYKGYTGRNPKSGKHVTVRSKKLPSFKAGMELKKRVDCYM
jgi:integration host factor subunit beta